MDRRTLLSGALSLPATPVLASVFQQAPGFYRTNVGDISVTTLYDGELRRTLDVSITAGNPARMAVQNPATLV